MSFKLFTDPIVRAMVEWLIELPDSGPWCFRVWRGQFLCLSKTSGLYVLKDCTLTKARP